MEMLFALFGGLAMFLYGMDRMSRALQRAAGDAMKRLLARLTATPLLGVLTGLAVTAVLQSSSAATVMVIGFVSAGLLELPRAVAVIYGINIGTTMTAQLIAFDAQQLVYPVLFAGFVIDFAARKARWQAVGEAVFSFGLLFEGIGILGGALQPLAGQEVFLGWMTRVKASPLLGVLLGLGMTMVVQSSSATIALLQNVARQAGPDGIHSVLGLAGAVPVLLGDNIGTTVTALLACIGQGRDAARAALAHSCFNLTGSLLAAALLLGALALFGAWSLWDIAATRRAALPEQTLRFKPLAAAPADSPGFAELRALNPDVCGWLTLDGTRIDLLENKVTLAVPEGNPKGVQSFDDLADKLKSGDVLLAIGNSDVPVGQYTQKIFAHYGLDEAALASAGVLTYGSNVKEVTTQVSEGAVDCGIIYATDAFSAGLDTVDEATADMCGQVIYPAAVLKNSTHADEAKAFLDYLTTDEAGKVFESVGFTTLA